jgi:hypothetical protein
MKKMLLISLGLLVLAGAAMAGNNVGTMAYLSWSNANHTTTNTASGPANNLFVRYERIGALMDFKGAEIDLIWSPTRSVDDAGCFEKLGTFFATSSSCTTSGYLNRGSNVPVTTIDDPNHFHVAWSNTAAAACEQGNACRIQFETDLCGDYGRTGEGCFTLTSALALDGANTIDQVAVAGPVATVDNGTQYCATPVEPSTWGKIKGLYDR